MTLKDCTLSALDYTQRLRAALKLGDMDMCAEILEFRGQAMQAFEVAHLAASEKDRKTCGKEIRSLQQADRDLQSVTNGHLEEVAHDFRKNLVTSQQASSVKAYSSGQGQACVDRKA